MPSITSDEAIARQTVSDLFELIVAQGDADYIGESISQLEHSLQAGELARKSGADDDTILGALLHDIGHFIPAAQKMPIMIAPDGTNLGYASHERVGAQYLRQLGFSEKVVELVGAHVMAKRYLTAVDKSYYDGLSDASRKSLKFQGGPFTEEEVEEASRDPFLEGKLAVRKWDDLAKVVDLEVPGLETYKEMAIQNVLSSLSERS